MKEKKIRLLSQEMINQIAAGEVIESPASVVKELVENSIDAKSSLIEVEISRGGLSFLRVSDNGIGMSREDLSLCLHPHATSKISLLADLEKVTSMGFRGEALASIAAISRVEITSRSQEKSSLLAYRLQAEKGIPPLIKEATRTRGTTVEVRSLFYTVPVRRKFQKSERQCTREVKKMVMQLALGHPHIHFTLYIEGKESFLSVSQKELSFHESLKGTIKEVFGSSFCDQLIPVDWKEGRCRVRGFLGKPYCACSHRNAQFLFIHHRAVLSLAIRQAIYEGYGSRLATHMHPIFILHITFPLEWVDVNVHPQKKEIRLREELQMKSDIQKAVLYGLEGGSLPHFSFSSLASPIKHSLPLKESIQKELGPTVWKAAEEKVTGESFLPFAREELPVIGIFSPFLLLDGENFGLSEKIPYLEESNEGILFIDLDRIEKQKVFHTLLTRGKKRKEIQRLLVPLPIEFTPSESEWIASHLSLLADIGIELRPFGENSYLIEALAIEIEEIKMKTFILEILHKLYDVEEGMRIGQEERRKIATAACRLSKRKQKNWTLEEAIATAKQFFQNTSSYYDPLGKPIVRYISREKLR